MAIFLARQEVLVPVGEVTQPSKYAQYPSGAGLRVINKTMRNPGEYVQAPDFLTAQSVGGANEVIHKLIPLDGGHTYAITFNGSVWSVFENGSSAAYGGSTSDAFSSTGRIAWARVKERLLINGRHGFLVGDYMQPSNSTERALRAAGLPQPTFSAFGTTEDGLGWLEDGMMVGYCACFVREFSDGYSIRSVPSPVVKLLLNPSGGGTRPFNVQASAVFTVGTLKSGDKVEVYRTDTLPTTDPGAEPGETFKLVKVYTLNSTDAANGFATIIDRQRTLPDSNVCPGEELYCNPGQEGASYINRRPPVAKCVASFKGFAFYGHTTDRAQWEFSVPGGIGAEYDIASYVVPPVPVDAFKAQGIGARVGGGTITSGSPTITSVSAADLVGVKVGQRWAFSTGFATAVDRVIAVGATSITMSANATASISGWILEDVIEIDGVVNTISSLDEFAYNASGKYELTCSRAIPVQSPRFVSGATITLERNTPPLDASITVRGTNGANYSPPIPELSATAQTFTALTIKNRIQWSKEQQPEHAPSVSEDFVGFGELYAMVETKDSVWMACSDGVHRLSGDSGANGLGNWDVNYANKSLILAGPQAFAAFNESVFGYFNDGFCQVDSAGNVTNHTDKIVGDVLPGTRYTETAGIIVEVNETDGELLLALGNNGVGSSDTIYLFNARQRGWTRLGAGLGGFVRTTAIAMQRSPSSGEARVLFGFSPLGGTSPNYAAWANGSLFLPWSIRYQPVYGDDPLQVKEWLWGDYLFDASNAGLLITPTWNGIAYGGQVALESYDQGAYARAGTPDEVRMSMAISPGLSGGASAVQVRFQGLSVPIKQRQNQGKSAQ